MECPRCQKDEFSPDGICLACNYKVVQKETVLEPESGKDTGVPVPQNSGETLPDNAATRPQKEELPSWRQELSERLGQP